MSNPLASVVDILAQIETIIGEDKKNHKNQLGCEYYFRGETKIFSHLTKSVCQTKLNCALDRDELLWRNEHDLYHEAYQVNPNDFIDDKTMVERLTRLQHYHLPTRFADLSKNALLSLFFACDDARTKDKDKLENGVLRIFKIDPRKMKSFSSDTIAAIAHLPLLRSEEFVLKSEDDCEGLRRLAYKVQVERPGFNVDHDETRKRLFHDIQQVWAFKPMWNNVRIKSQDGIFLAFGCRDRKEPLYPDFSEANFDIEGDVEALDPTRPSCGIMQIASIFIDKNAKRSIVEALRSYGIAAEKVYPDLSDACQAISERRINPPDEILKRSSANNVFWGGFDAYCRRLYNITGIINRDKTDKKLKGNTAFLSIVEAEGYSLSFVLKGGICVSLAIAHKGTSTGLNLINRFKAIATKLSAEYKIDAASMKKAAGHTAARTIICTEKFEYAVENKSTVDIYSKMIAMICHCIKELRKEGIAPDENSIPSQINDLVNLLD